jgi:predicted RNA binding protein YcfA (HicA-like mRNA interferase family)
MTKQQKLIQKVLEGKTISTDEAIKLLLDLDFIKHNQNSGTSHVTYKKGREKITLVLNMKELKKYQIKLLQETLKINNIF